MEIATGLNNKTMNKLVFLLFDIKVNRILSPSFTISVFYCITLNIWINVQNPTNCISGSLLKRSTLKVSYGIFKGFKHLIKPSFSYMLQ